MNLFLGLFFDIIFHFANFLSEKKKIQNKKKYIIQIYYYYISVVSADEYRKKNFMRYIFLRRQQTIKISEFLFF